MISKVTDVAAGGGFMAREIHDGGEQSSAADIKA